MSWSRAAAVVAAVFVVGCGQPVPVQIKDLPGDAELIDEAFAILGVEYEFSDRERGTIYIGLFDTLDADDPGRRLRGHVATRRSSRSDTPG